MFVDLNYTSRKKLPIGYSMVGGIVESNGLGMLLLRNEVDGGRYAGFLDGTVHWLDQEAVAQAVQKARDDLARVSDTPPCPAPAIVEKKKLYSVNLDEWAAQTLRAYGDGNLSAGIRAAAKLLVGAV